MNEVAVGKSTSGGSSKTPCKRKTCPDFTRRGYEFCSGVCRQVDTQVRLALAKGDKASMAELSALLGVVDSVNLWRCAVMAEDKRSNAGNST